MYFKGNPGVINGVGESIRAGYQELFHVISCCKTKDC